MDGKIYTKEEFMAYYDKYGLEIFLQEIGTEITIEFDREKKYFKVMRPVKDFYVATRGYPLINTIIACLLKQVDVFKTEKAIKILLKGSPNPTTHE